MPEYDLYLAVIDLDSPKKENDIPISDLLKICNKWITKTHTRKTPSGGHHIYLLSKSKPVLKQPSFNVDYQTNTGKLMGKYVVCNYRYATRINGQIVDLEKYYKEHKKLELGQISFEKEFYEKVPESPDRVLVVDSTDEILSEIIEEIENQGLWTPPIKKKLRIVEKNKKIRSKQNQKDLVEILKVYVHEGTRDELAKALSGYLYKKRYSLDKCRKIFKQIFYNDEEIDHRLDFLERTFDKPRKDVAGITALRQLVSPQDIDKIKKIVEKQKKPDKKEIDFNIIDIDEKIAYYLEYGYNVTDKMIIESVEKTNTLFFESSSLNYYVKNGDNSIKLIDGLFIVNHCNNLFGYNEISKNQCYRALNFVTRPIKKEPYVLEFTNGLVCINTEYSTPQFMENVKCGNYIPKISFPFRWNPKAEGGAIKESVYSILYTNKKGFSDNINTYLKSVGHSCMGSIEKAIFPIIIGPPGTGKSTLLTMLKRFLTYSEVPIPDIIKNDRFSLTPAVGKDINIDDDLQSEVWKGIGKLNTLISGNGGSVEIKGENERLELTTYNTPKLWGGSNALPPVIGDGFQRRLIIIVAENIIPPEEMNDSFQMDILNGLYDEGLEWLVYHSIMRYLDVRGKSFVSEEDKQAMLKEHNFKSDPLKNAIEHIFKYEEDVDIPIKNVHREIKRWFRYAKKTNKIFDEHMTPSVRTMDSAMNRAGFAKTKKNFSVYDEELDKYKHSSHMVYEDIKLSKKWLEEYGKFESTEKFLG